MKRGTGSTLACLTRPDIGRFIFNVILFTAIGHYALVQAGIEEKETLRVLCSGKTVKLTKISQVSRLIDHIQHIGTVRHCEKVITSIKELKPVLDATRDDVCSEFTIERLREYYLDYIEAKNVHRGIPSPVRTFFLALGFTISKTCKKIVVSSLVYDSEALLTEDDFETIDVWTGLGSPFASIIGKPSDFDDLILASDAFSEFFGVSRDSDDKGKLILKTTTRKLLHKIQDACQKRFKPIYMQIIVPNVRLSHMGFSYHGEDLEIELDEIATNKKIQKWYKIVYICDALENVMLVDGHQEDSNVVQILSKEEATMLSRSGLNQTKNQDYSGLKPIVYERDKLQIEDEVLAEDDKNLAKMINNYSKRKSLGDRIRGQLFSKVTRFAAQLLSSGKVNLVGSMFKDNEGGKTGLTILNNLDKHIHTPNYLDSPVAQASHDEGAGGASSPPIEVHIHTSQEEGKGSLFPRWMRELSWASFLVLIICLFTVIPG